MVEKKNKVRYNDKNADAEMPDGNRFLHTTKNARKSLVLCKWRKPESADIKGGKANEDNI